MKNALADGTLVLSLDELSVNTIVHLNFRLLLRVGTLTFKFTDRQAPAGTKQHAMKKLSSNKGIIMGFHPDTFLSE